MQRVLARLDTLEAFVGLRVRSRSPPTPNRQRTESECDDPAFAGLWKSLAALKNSTHQVARNGAWASNTVKELWIGYYHRSNPCTIVIDEMSRFHNNMPSLHFLPNRQTFSTPTPLLLASMLYVSSLRHPEPGLAGLCPDYFKIMCEAISLLCIPQAETDETVSPSDLEENAFQDVLGIILAGLTCEASAKTTGIWISIGYRLVLESCSREVDARSREWQLLFSGLQVSGVSIQNLKLTSPRYWTLSMLPFICLVLSFRYMPRYPGFKFLLRTISIASVR